MKCCQCKNTSYIPDETPIIYSLKWDKPQQNVWICKMCTFKNQDMKSSKCTMCASLKSANIANNKSLQTSSCNYVDEQTNTWICQICTFQNKHSFSNKCKMCQSQMNAHNNKEKKFEVNLYLIKSDDNFVNADDKEVMYLTKAIEGISCYTDLINFLVFGCIREFETQPQSFNIPFVIKSLCAKYLSSKVRTLCKSIKLSYKLLAIYEWRYKVSYDEQYINHDDSTKCVIMSKIYIGILPSTSSN